MDNKFNNNGVTNTTRFLMPVFGIDRKELEKTGFINAYLKDKNIEHELDDVLIYALFKPKENLQFKRFLKKLDEKKMVYTDYDYEQNHVVVVFTFPERYKNDYKLIIEGKYSKCSDEFKLLFDERFETGNPPNVYLSIPYSVLNKTEFIDTYLAERFNIHPSDLGDVERWEIINLEDETLDIDKILSKKLV